MSSSSILAAALNTIREADAARTDALAALADLPPYIARALGSQRNTPAHVERLARVAPLLLALPMDDGAPAPHRLHPHETCGDAAIAYVIGGDPFRWDAASAPVGDWCATVAALLARHPAIPVSVYKGGCTAIRPDARPSRGEEEGKARPIFPVTVTANKTDGYAHEIVLTWWSELAPGVVVRVEMTGRGHNELTNRVRYAVTNAPRSERVVQRPEDRRWEVSHTWGGAPDAIRWWSSPGNPPRVTWTWPVGADFGAALAPVSK